METIPPQKRIAIVAPDKASGGDFAETVFKKLQEHGFSVATYYSEIPARVVAKDGVNVITPNQEDVSVALSKAIETATKDGEKGANLTIACNTLSLKEKFVDRALQILEEKGLKDGEDFKLLTTLDAIKDKYKDEGRKPPLFLGTSALSKELPESEFETLYTKGSEELGNLVQEIIWRVKATEGSDVSTAPTYEDFNDESKLKEKVDTLVAGLKNFGINEIILGCTELPIAFKKYAQEDHNLILVDPAEVVAERLIKNKV